jgi:hypothetical protein
VATGLMSGSMAFQSILTTLLIGCGSTLERTGVGRRVIPCIKELEEKRAVLLSRPEKRHWDVLMKLSELNEIPSLTKNSRQVGAGGGFMAHGSSDRWYVPSQSLWYQRSVSVHRRSFALRLYVLRDDSC